ncbi:putative flap structure-specific endonuclease protein [Botrytis fragariae]|uniref:Putative flap structure-specific endonuclease protein n=1 Tax=Botrytis fragariae TaxID=1964551 RepID=A0A8H6AJS0_9HELO|nr:putative flap structure-specific endonuclease protein [Botrytis fragariae]KAF5868639.1 putative flap structure-specific endonuclease protein [Botrytis fragariae]
MGIKGIYGEIGPGERVALSKISIEKYEKTGIPLRIAIDISIWNFQIQSGQGGTNPALRTLYYRLLRLLSISVQPLFVFDGPHKPPVKRNKQTGRSGASIPDLMTKELLKLFGFAYHIAPGEAEAECALLQREGIVDAVLSEDVDTLMFGSGLTFRSWSAGATEKKSGAGSPTHVNVYDAKATKAGKSGLDREGMILVALMSGGDYKTEGIPGCGVKVACEAARAGFGKRLCQIRREDVAAYDEWRADLAHELFTNESKFFRTKRKALQIPEDFPDRKVLGYYTHPVVSSLAKVERLRNQIVWEGEINIPRLRNFVGDAFEWKGKEGAKKFVRGLAPVLLLTKLRQRGDRQDSEYDDPMLTKLNEMELVKSICGQRRHVTTDEVPELRVIYQPLEIVDIDLDEEDNEVEDYGRDGLAPLLEDDQIQAYASDDAAPADTPRKRGPSPYDPTKADKLWIFESIVKVGVPLTVEDYEEALRDPKKALQQKAAAKRAETKTTKSRASSKSTGGMSKGAMDRFIERSEKSTRSTAKASSQRTQNVELSEDDLPPQFLAPSIRSPKSPVPGVAKKRLTRGRKPAAIKEKENPRLNPWATSQSSFSQPLPQITKPSRLRKPSTPTKTFQTYGSMSPSPKPQYIPSPLSRQKHRQQPISLSDDEANEPSLSPPRTPIYNDRPSPRKKRSSPPANTTSGLSSPLAALHTNPSTRPPLTPQPINRKIDFSLHSSSNKSSSSGCSSISKSSYKTAPSQNYSPGRIIDLTSSPPGTPSAFPEPLIRDFDDSPGYPKLVIPSSSPLPMKTSPQYTNHDYAYDYEHIHDHHNTYTPTYHTTININTTIYNITNSPSHSPLKPKSLKSLSQRNPQGENEKEGEKINEIETIREQTIETEIVEENVSFEHGKKEKNTRRYIMLRESLPGSWREVGREELVEGRSRAWRAEEVEVLDLTGE